MSPAQPKKAGGNWTLGRRKCRRRSRRHGLGGRGLVGRGQENAPNVVLESRRDFRGHKLSKALADYRRLQPIIEGRGRSSKVVANCPRLCSGTTSDSQPQPSRVATRGIRRTPKAFPTPKASCERRSKPVPAAAEMLAEKNESPDQLSVRPAVLPPFTPFRFTFTARRLRLLRSTSGRLLRSLRRSFVLR